MTNEDRIWQLLARRLAGEATEEELNELETLISKDPGRSYSIGLISEWWKANEPVKKEERNYEAQLAKLRQRVKLYEESRKHNPQGRKTQNKRRLSQSLKVNLMFRDQFKTAWRNLVRGRAFSLINITGLAIGMTSAILILLWIQNELSFDRFHKNKNNLYRAYSRGIFNGKMESWGGTSMLLGPIMEMNYPEVAATARVNEVGAFIFHAGENHLESKGLITDPAFLKMFDFPLLQGDVNTALNSPRSLVITKKFSQKLFGDVNPVGKMVGIDSNANFIVTAVMKDLPNNTQFKFDYLVPWSYMKEVHWDRPTWGASDIGTFVQLKEGVSEEKANARFANIVKLNSKESKTELFLHPISKWRLWSEFENGKAVAGYIKTVRLFAIIAGFILLIACINYMNLSTARSVKRGKEVGIRKVSGARRSSLIGQFLGESVMIAFVAGILALLIAQPSLGWFNKLTQKELFIPYTDPYFWLCCIAFIIFTGILAGSYPAFYLSAHKPIKVLKGTFKAVNALVAPRKIMVVLQFTFAIALIICTVIIHRQIRYGQNRDAGFDKNDLVYTYLKGDMAKNYKVISTELVNSGSVTAITRTNSPITSIWNGDDSYEWTGKKEGEATPVFCIFHTDKDFAKTMGLTLISGRDINAEKYPSDSGAIILNETAMKLMGFKDASGQIVKSNDGNWHVVGIVKDFVAGSPFEPAFPISIQGPGEDHWYGTMSFRLNPAKSTSNNLAAIGAILKKYNPDYPFDYYFADASHAIKFEEEKRTETLAGIFAGLTIFISCLGLFALAAYMAESRTKEIGVRKVLGASVATIGALLSKDFLKLVIISFVIASPLAWWAMHSWLQNYGYRISIGWWVFVLVGLISMLIAIVTVSFQAIKAAVANPVKSLRTE